MERPLVKEGDDAYQRRRTPGMVLTSSLSTIIEHYRLRIGSQTALGARCFRELTVEIRSTGGNYNLTFHPLFNVTE